MRIFKVFSYLVIVVWILGATIFFFGSIYEEKSICIQEEGWFKGWLWCERQSKTHVRVGVENTGVVVSSLLWPLYYLSSSEGDNQINFNYYPKDGRSLTPVELTDTGVSSFYGCYAMAVVLVKEKDAHIIHAVIDKWRKINKVPDSHDDVYLLYGLQYVGMIKKENLKEKYFSSCSRLLLFDNP